MQWCSTNRSHVLTERCSLDWYGRLRALPLLDRGGMQIRGVDTKAAAQGVLHLARSAGNVFGLISMSTRIDAERGVRRKDRLHGQELPSLPSLPSTWAIVRDPRDPAEPHRAAPPPPRGCAGVLDMCADVLVFGFGWWDVGDVGAWRETRSCRGVTLFGLLLMPSYH